MNLDIQLAFPDDERAWAPTSAAAIPINGEHPPALGDMLLIEGTYWVVSGRIWSGSKDNAKLELWLVRNVEWTANRRREQIREASKPTTPGA